MSFHNNRGKFLKRKNPEHLWIRKCLELGKQRTPATPVRGRLRQENGLKF